MSLTPLQSSSFNQQTVNKLTQINAPSGDQTLKVEEFVAAADSDKDGALSDQEISTSGIHADDVQAITTAYRAHSSDPTSALVSFETPTPTESVPAEATPAESVPADLQPLQLPALADAQGLSESRSVLRGPELDARLGELETQADQGLSLLAERKTALQQLQPAPADLDTRLTAIDQAAAKLGELKQLLGRRSEPQAVQELQQFLINNDNGTQADQSFQDRLTYQKADGQNASVDNLYGARTDSGLRDFVSRLVQDTRVGGPHAPATVTQEPATEPATETVPEAVTESVTEPVTEPATDPAVVTPDAVTPTAYNYGALPSFALTTPSYSYGALPSSRVGANPSFSYGALPSTFSTFQTPGRFDANLFSPDIYQTRLPFTSSVPGDLDPSLTGFSMTRPTYDFRLTAAGQ